jgi:hypothetical protein
LKGFGHLRIPAFGRLEDSLAELKKKERGLSGRPLPIAALRQTTLKE